MAMTADFIELSEGEAPLLVSLPHTGTLIPPDIEAHLNDGWRARCDADWHVDKLYDFAVDLGATVVRTRICRTVIDVNRDPSGVSLYPGQTTTGLCPTETFDGERLYRSDPQPAEIERRRERFFDPYHQVLCDQIARLRGRYSQIVLYDAHAIRSRVPRLFEGLLPQFNIGTNGGQSCATALSRGVEELCARSGLSHITDGRFKGGWITRHYGRPEAGVHAIQMELACRGYLHEPDGPLTPKTWPVSYDEAYATPLRATLARILEHCLTFARAT